MPQTENNRTLWGITSTSVDVVKIYIDPTLKASAETDWVENCVLLHPDIVLDPLCLDETLMHEFVHVLENHFEKELKAKPPRGCSNEATIFGRELTRMLRQLRRIKQNPAGAVGPTDRSE